MVSSLLGALLFIAALHFSHGYYQSGKEHYREAHALVQWINDNRHHIASSGELPQRHAGSLLERVGGKASLHGISQERIQPQGEHRLQLWLHEVLFENLANWLKDLAEENIHVLSVQIDRADRNGYVNVQCLLSDGTH